MVRIRDLPLATLPLTGAEQIELEQGLYSRKVSLTSLLAGLSAGTFTPPGAGALARLANGKMAEVVSALDFIPEAQHANIRNGTTTYDATANIQSALNYGSALYFPSGVYRIAGNITIAAKSMTIYGDGVQVSIIRQTTSGGIVFNGGAVTQNYNMPVLNMHDIRIEAAAQNAGTAVTMTYTGGSGTPPLGPVWTNVVIAPSVEARGPTQPGFNIGVRGSEVRNLHWTGVTITGNSTSVGHPIVPQMTEGCYFDGVGDPVELWLSECYFYFLQTCIRVGGFYEGIYIDRCTSLAVWGFLQWDANTPQPTIHLSNNYIGSERFGAKIDMVSYLRIFNNTFNPTAPVPNASYIGLTIDRTSANQTQAGDCFNNTFIGVGYSRTNALYTETAIWLKNTNTMQVNNNTTYDMNVGILGTAGSGNRLVRNRYIAVPLQESVPASMRTHETQPEVVFLARRSAATQSIPVNVQTQVVFDTVNRDDRGYYTVGTGVLALPAGFYRVRGRIRMTNMVVGDYLGLYVTSGGAQIEGNGLQIAVAGTNVLEINGTIEIPVSANIAIAILIETAVGAATRTLLNSDVSTRFEVEAIGG